MKKAIVVEGNLSEGFKFFGPFEDFDAAASYTEGSSTEWWIATLDDTGVPVPKPEPVPAPEEPTASGTCGGRLMVYGGAVISCGLNKGHRGHHAALNRQGNGVTARTTWKNTTEPVLFWTHPDEPASIIEKNPDGSQKAYHDFENKRDAQRFLENL